ncbi:hypothetical protein RRG08_004768 [Elysia crispata]|uniref:Uncharacterized protein n=1 Tax=Elysia crispata TaxID=231223 RepID=A0AAE1E0L4_9GAST|nr:hypothetical protein RRG08_004768 [Elysia crispata]
MKIDVSVELNVPYDDQAVSVLIEDATCRVKNRSNSRRAHIGAPKCREASYTPPDQIEPGYLRRHVLEDPRILREQTTFAMSSFESRMTKQSLTYDSHLSCDACLTPAIVCTNSLHV